MKKPQAILQKGLIYGLTVALVSGAPVSAFATDQSSTQEETPKTYTYDSQTKRWNSDEWTYNPKTDSYVPAEQKTKQIPAEEQTDTQEETSASDSTVEADSTTEITGETKIDNDIDVTNTQSSGANTGEASVSSNTEAGHATSGDALAEATIINSVHSVVGDDVSGIAQFTYDIDGNIVGDITIGPAIEGVEKNTRSTTIKSQTNIDNDIQITNDISLSAESGDAIVSNNTKAGDATSGNADTVANIINLINTIIVANKSFVGTINIHGNLDGDILISPEFLPQVLASNGQSSYQSTTSVNDDHKIANNVTLNATSGGAIVSSNTDAGSATTGDTSTNLTILNLTGHEVNAASSMLVFVNVLGSWVGMIVDAEGATAAALGSGVMNSAYNVSSETSIDNKHAITNNIALTSQTGDASVTGNTQAGDATSGSATASANIANISASAFQLSDWFGVLFINVFGSWIGSFGADTNAGNIVARNNAVQAKNTGAGPVDHPDIRIGFVPKAQTISSDSVGDRMLNEPSDADEPSNESARAMPGLIQKRDNDTLPMVVTVLGLSMLGGFVALRRWA